MFNVVGDSLARMFRKSQEKNLICGLVPHLIPAGVAILHYADNMIILFQDDQEMAINVKFLLYPYESMAGLKINFDKSEILLTLEDFVKLETYAYIFYFQMGMVQESE
jgi:hypothetical protein